MGDGTPERKITLEKYRGPYVDRAVGLLPQAIVAGDMMWSMLAAGGVWLTHSEPDPQLALMIEGAFESARESFVRQTVDIRTWGVWGVPSDQVLFTIADRINGDLACYTNRYDRTFTEKKYPRRSIFYVVYARLF